MLESSLYFSGTTRPVSLMVSPSRTQHFINDSLSLSCEGQSDSTGWRVRRYTHSEKVSDCSSGWGSVTGSTCSISSLYTSHTGVYWCESESGESSNPVNITVHNGAVILDSPVHPVTEGDPLTLHCLYRDPKPSNFTAEFYKDGSLLQTPEMTISTVSNSDEGLHHCKHPERGESPQSWISVRNSEFNSVIIGVVVVLSLILILIIIIIVGLFWCYKKKKGNQQNTSQTSNQSQNPRSTQADDSAAGYSDVTYAQVMIKKKKFRGKVTTSDEVTYSQIAMKSLKQDSKDSGLESDDVIYAQIYLKYKKKPKKTQENLFE
ncbi:putative high affinity immunoglobulin gamma Fc receptor IC, partial [Colossoma macropomum]|uniref:putative high affinity immunoglobulin gamma Fc receptor IC n=1 Tax=Colossoma macropomum TaxID=42526 RepID=UPI0018649164